MSHWGTLAWAENSWGGMRLVGRGAAVNSALLMVALVTITQSPNPVVNDKFQQMSVFANVAMLFR